MTKSIHISDIRTFRQCRRKWLWSSPLGRNLEPTVPYVPFFTGRAIHHALEMYYSPKHIPLAKGLDQFLIEESKVIEQLGPLWPVEKASFESEVEMMRGILDHYQLWTSLDNKVYSDKNLEFISLETEFDVPLRTATGKVSAKARLGGRFDGVVKHKPTDTYWIWECKTTRSVKELIHSLANDEQCGVYIHAAQEMLGVPVAGVLYNIIRKKVPTRPKELQNGTLSQASNIDCTAFFYRQCVTDMYPDWSPDTIHGFYGPLLDSLVSKENEFFMRFPIYRTPYEIKGLMKNIFYTANEMLNPKLQLYPAPSWLNCTMCHFRSPCLTMNSGGEYEILLREEYQLRESSRSIRAEGLSTDEQ